MFDPIAASSPNTRGSSVGADALADVLVAAVAAPAPLRLDTAAATTERTHPAVLPHPAARAAACQPARSSSLNRTTRATSRTTMNPPLDDGLTYLSEHSERDHQRAKRAPHPATADERSEDVQAGWRGACR